MVKFVIAVLGVGEGSWAADFVLGADVNMLGELMVLGC